MPMETVVFVSFVTVMYAVFAAALAWAEYQTRR